MRVSKLAFSVWVVLAACQADGDSQPGSGVGAGGQPTAGCGNGICAGEDCASCPQDCGPCPASCGNDLCDTGESCRTCPHDCYALCSCGDGFCTNMLEDCIACTADCGVCPPGCPDGSCDMGAGESCTTCPLDCGACQDVCGDGACGWTETCSSCAQDCGTCTTCGNGVCEPGETCDSCNVDCEACTYCGDGWCDWDEDCDSCSEDCGACTYCGDGWCDWDEDCDSCPSDCGGCTDPCADGITNDDETDIDCGGGTCPDCPDWWNCVEDSDCESDSCIDGLCYPCDSARLVWNAPTAYSDGTCMPITDLWGFNVYWGQTSGGPYPNVEPLTLDDAGCYDTTTPDPEGCGTLWECTYTIFDLTNGTWYFTVSSVAVGGAESVMPPEVWKTFACP